jgi:hypothetical protein
MDELVGIKAERGKTNTVNWFFFCYNEIEETQWKWWWNQRLWSQMSNSRQQYWVLLLLLKVVKRNHHVFLPTITPMSLGIMTDIGKKGPYFSIGNAAEIRQ